MSLKHNLSLFLLLFIANLSFSQQNLVINELDCDTPGLDNMEFLELKSILPSYPLDGFTVVFFNGSSNGNNTSYLALDLDGYTTDINGIFLIGSNTVTPFPQYIIPENSIQNGADAVAIYKGNADAFLPGTVAYVDQNLVDVLIYSTTDPDATSMIDIFKAFNPSITQINEGITNNTNSIQRNNDGTYTSTTPTPRRPNDGSGIVIIGIRSLFEKKSYNEGETFEINFTSDANVTEDLNIRFTLNNFSFNNNDFSGTTNLTISKGSNTTATTISLIDDVIDEGDEEFILNVQALPSNYLALNNNIKIRVVDNDFKVANFGTPIQPTYQKVKSTQPPGFYQSINGQSGAALYSNLQNIIANPAIVRAQTYNDVTDILKEADQNPENSNQVWLVYLEKGRAKLDFQFSSDNFNTWNREHTWPRSRGGFNSIEADDTVDGKDIYWLTGPDSLRHANSDAHAIRPEDGPENSSRGNQFYGEYTGPVGTKGGFKGDVARGIFYLAVRFNGLEVVNGFPEGQVGKFGDLATLLEWHRNDPPDDYEMNRNNVVYTWQYNRNPFIDMPDLVEYIYGNKKDQIWQNPSKTVNMQPSPFKISPNPATNQIFISGVQGETFIQIFNMYGSVTENFIVQNDSHHPLNLVPGLYLITFKSNEKIWVEKLVIK